MEINKDNELVIERASDMKALSSFNCGVRAIDILIHRHSRGLYDFIF